MKNFKDVYLFPLEADKFCSWVWDAKGNFVFQFQCDDMEVCKNLLRVINGKTNLANKTLKFIHEGGLIKEVDSGEDIILIRGWGNLTGIGGHNLPPKEAANIQDTFAEYIVERLNART